MSTGGQEKNGVLPTDRNTPVARVDLAPYNDCMNKYTRRLVLPIDEVLWHVRAQQVAESMYGFSVKRRQPLHGFEVGMTSLRLRTFARDSGNLRCAHCGIEGKFFSIDSHREQLTYTHLNLFAVDDKGEEVLLTCDHILARGLGGADDLSNTQVLCSPCNSFKSKEESRITNEIRRELNILMVSKKIPDMLQNDVAKGLIIKWTGRMNNPTCYTQ